MFFWGLLLGFFFFFSFFFFSFSHSPVINPNLLSFIHAFGGWLRSEQPTTRKGKGEIVSILIDEIMNSSRERERLTDISWHSRRNSQRKRQKRSPIEAMPVPVYGLLITTIQVIHYISQLIVSTHEIPHEQDLFGPGWETRKNNPLLTNLFLTIQKSAMRIPEHGP